MRKLIVMRGHQGSGKSTFIRAVGLDGYTLSPDVIRRTVGSAVMGLDGQIGTPQEFDPRVWAQFFEHLAERMGRGELIVVDATHRKRKDFKQYLKLAYEHRYTVACVDLFGEPIELALARDAGRPRHTRVPEAVVRRFHEDGQGVELPDEIHHIRWAEDGRHAAELEAWLAEPVLDLSSYRAVVHIGDLQGCLTPLLEFLGGTELADDTFYIFVGDLCDRGIENGAVIQQMLAWIDRPNVRVLWGNHEDHLHRWSRGFKPKSDEFNLRTQPQLEAAGITPEQVDHLCDQLVEVLSYTWHDQQVLVTHAGMPAVPPDPERISGRQYGKGPGRYGSPIDRLFSEQAPPGWTQVHGHRNTPNLPIQAGRRSYNLESRVEFGGDLRVVTLDNNGFNAQAIRNRVFKSLKQRIQEGSAVWNKKIHPPWVGPEMPDAPLIDVESLRELTEHELIQVKPARSRPYIAAFNFTRDAFFSGAWDELNITARGLFINTESREIVARSYNKFFNVGERPETTLESMEANLVFPVRVYRKDNGFLGIVGYDAVADDLFFASKSTPDGEFAGWCRELVSAGVGPLKLDPLRIFLRDTQSCMVFEVLDPDNDPHMIEYPERTVILLDVVRRSQHFERVPDDTLLKIGKFFNLQTKRRAMVFQDWSSLSKWMARAHAPDYLFEGSPVEGFVLEDAQGFQVKLKLDFYSFWKKMRGLKQRILKTRGTQRPLGRDTSNDRVRHFVEWCQAQPDQVLELDIITLRKAYLDGELPEGIEFAPPPPVESRAAQGFRRALDGIEASGEIKAATADEMLSRALADDAKMAILAAHSVRTPLVLAASQGEARDAAAEAVGLDLD